MQKTKKVLLIMIITLIICVVLAGGSILFYKAKAGEDKTEETTTNKDSQEELERSFLNYFTNINYTQEEQAIVIPIYEITKSEENKYEVDVHLPKIDLNSCDNINNEIMQIFGSKLLNIIKSNEVYTKYNVDYVTFTNNSVVSLVIKATLKEGDTPQRLIIKTYNYDLNAEKLITFEEMLERKNLDSKKIQELINTNIKAYYYNTETLANQGYNIYVRKMESDEYKIQNVENYYLNNEGEVFVVFAYGNKNFTGTMDIINVTK